jgi:Domain of unknown function (DUF4387)
MTVVSPPFGTRMLRELACVIRSKNAKPYRLTLDVFFDDRRVFEHVKRTGALDDAAVAELYGLDLGALRSSFIFDEAMAFKFTFRRPVTQGAVGDSDVYGAQQHVPLLDLRIPWGADAPAPDGTDSTEEKR